MKKRRFVSTIFAAAATLAASAVSFTPADNSTTFFKEGSAGEQIFVGETDSAKITFTPESFVDVDKVLLISGSGAVKDTVKLTTDLSFKIGTYKCYTLLYYTGENEKSQKTYLSYIKKSPMSPKVKVCDYDSVYTICDENLKIKFSGLTYPNAYVNANGDTIVIKDNTVLSYEDYEADGITIKDKQVDLVINGDEVNKDSTLSIQKPRRRTVFKLKDEFFPKYEYVSDTFYSMLPFIAAQLRVDAEEIPHNTEKRSDEELIFGTLSDAKTNVGKYMFSGPLEISLEHNAVDNSPFDTIITSDPKDPTKISKELVPVDAKYTWKFYNDSTGRLRNRYCVFNVDISQMLIQDYGTHFITLECDNSVCKDTLVAAFKMNNSYLLMPSVFTPNGDGINDEFRPTYTSIREYQIWIYNTMGVKMYESEDITIGWDGTHKGHDCPIGAYYYVVKATGVDGKEYKLKGTVNLVRKAEN